jgi:hypothetical protein
VEEGTVTRTDAIILPMRTIATMDTGSRPRAVLCGSRFSRKAFRRAFGCRPSRALRPGRMMFTIETVRPQGARKLFVLKDRGGYLESVDAVPEPHEFAALVRLNGGRDVYSVAFREHEHAHGAAHRDNNMRAAIIHVLADAAVSVLVIVGLLLGRFLGWTWMDPVAGLCGAIVIAAWSYGLVKGNTGAILLDMNPDRGMADRMRAIIEVDGDRLTDLHLWRLGPGHLGAILSVDTQKPRGPEYYQSLVSRFHTLSHVTVQVQHQ